MTTVLYTQKNSIHNKLGCDCWDIIRDARKYDGNSPVIAHPPCRAWGKLKNFAKPRPDEKELALHAINVIRKNGGVLEHPKDSGLWPNILPLPGTIDEYGGWTLFVHQKWFGHKAQKKTYLYIVGCKPKDIPDYPISFDVPTHIINFTKQNGKTPVSKKEREATPYDLAKWLIDLINKIQVKND